MSRIIGTVFPDGTEPIKINQFQHAQPDGHYKIQDMDKRTEYENLKKSKNK